MIRLLYKWKLKRDVRKLHKKLITSLEEYLPELAENDKHWKLNMMTVSDHEEKFIHLLHMTTDNAYQTKNKARQRKNFKIEGVELIHKQSGEFVPLKILVYGNLIQYIYLQFNRVISREYNIDSIRINKLSTEELKTENPDEESLRQILSRLPKDKLDLIEIADTFEIDLNNKYYYTIFDLENGNYIAVDKKGQVYRLIHDHENPVKKIADNVTFILESYTGDKKELEKFMDE